ncbi:hypothetical protein Tco_1328932, partial [Tanacetum coccineum]
KHESSYRSTSCLDNALVAPEKRLKIEKCNVRIKFSKPQREETYQVTPDALKLSPCYTTFLITAEVPEDSLGALRKQQDFSQPKVLDEQQDKTTGKNEGTDTKPGVPDVPKDQYESENEFWGNSKDDDSNDDDSDDVSNDDDDDVDSDADGDNEASDSEKTDSDKDENPNLNQNDDEEEEY